MKMQCQNFIGTILYIISCLEIKKLIELRKPFIGSIKQTQTHRQLQNRTGLHAGATGDGHGSNK